MELFLLVILTVPSYLPVSLTGFIDEILQSHVKNLGSYIKDTTDFLRKWQNVPYVLRNRGYSKVFVKYPLFTNYRCTLITGVFRFLQMTVTCDIIIQNFPLNIVFVKEKKQKCHF